MPEQHVDISPFIARLSKAFLPSCVLELEEYGLPRMLSKQIHSARLIDFEDETLTLHRALDVLNEKRSEITTTLEALDPFDRYVLDYFFEGISRQ